jgi:hypothetical protein
MTHVSPVLSSDAEGNWEIINKKPLRELMLPSSSLTCNKYFSSKENQSRWQVSIGLWLEFRRKKGLVISHPGTVVPPYRAGRVHERYSMSNQGISTEVAIRQPPPPPWPKLLQSGLSLTTEDEELKRTSFESALSPNSLKALATK